MLVKLVKEFPVHGSLPEEQYTAHPELVENFKNTIWARWSGRIIKVGLRTKAKHWTCNTVYIWPSSDPEFNRDCGGSVLLCSHMFEIVNITKTGSS